MSHITVLLHEAINSLNLRPASVVVDCTLGSGGHAAEILRILDANSIFIGIDKDPTALAAFKAKLPDTKATVLLEEANFSDIANVLAKHDVTQVDAVLADLGWRMEQFDGSSGMARGFSFQSDEPLHMTYGDPSDYPFTAYDIVNDWREEDIANIIYAYGEERQARRIARFIVEARVRAALTTAADLAAVVEQSIPKRFQNRRIHPATKTFQALRIAVNDEFDTLRSLLETVPHYLAATGRFSVISFHSTEDRIVKHSFRSLVHDHDALLVNKKPIVADIDERASNPRARSAKLRTIEKI